MGADDEHGSAADQRLNPAEHGKSQLRLLRRPRPRNEWVGGFIPFPWEAADYLDPPRVAVWLELPEGVVVGAGVESTEGDALVDALREALTEPLAGPPRRPDALRVADDRMADAVRFALSGEIPVATGATPEIEDFEERLRKELEELGDHELSHFDGGVSAESFERLFRTTSELFTAEPWSIVDDVEVLQIDVPSLDVEGACVSIRGASSDIRGLMVFPSYDEFNRHWEAALDFDERLPNTGMFVEMVLVGFHPEADVPPSMLAEVREHGWRLAGTDVYPLVSCLDEEGFPREATERDIAVVSATAHAIAELFNRHWDLFESQGLPRFTRSFRDEAGHRVKVTVPHPVLDVELEDERHDDFDPPQPTEASQTLARGTDLGPPEDPSPEEAGPVASLKAEHYADWADHPLPALSGRTPRACMETAAGRADVDRLLKDMEYREELAPGPSFDFSIMRRDLGLEAD